MGWAEKALERHKLQKQIEEIMKSPEYKEMQRKQDEQAVLHAFVQFCCIACSYLETKHYYKGNGLKTFLKHVLSHMEYTVENEKYFEEYRAYVKEEYNLDIFAELGLEIGEEGEADGKGGT